MNADHQHRHHLDIRDCQEQYDTHTHIQPDVHRLLMTRTHLDIVNPKQNADLERELDLL